MKILRMVAQALLLVLMIPVGLQVLIGLPLLLNSLNQPREMLSVMLGQMAGGALILFLFFVVFRKLGGEEDQLAPVGSGTARAETMLIKSPPQVD
jgi:hypothetical protein